MRSARFAAVLLPLVVGCSVSGCSISTSPSDIASALSGSSTSSSRDRRAAYKAEVCDYTDAYVRSAADVAGFWNGLAHVAAEYGVSDFEADDATWIGIGQGLRKARVTSQQLDVYKANFSDGDATKAAAIQRGYDQEH